MMLIINSACYCLITDSILLLNKCLFSFSGNTGTLLTDSLCDGVMALLENTTKKSFYLVLLLPVMSFSRMFTEDSTCLHYQWIEPCSVCCYCLLNIKSLTVRREKAWNIQGIENERKFWWICYGCITVHGHQFVNVAWKKPPMQLTWTIYI